MCIKVITHIHCRRQMEREDLGYTVLTLVDYSSTLYPGKSNPLYTLS